MFSDRVKAEIGETIGELKRLGISLKVITGGNQRVTAYVGRQVGLMDARILTGSELRSMGHEALVVRVRDVDGVSS